MEIKLTQEESEKYLHNAFCNGLGYMLSGYGLEMDYKDKDYKAAKKWLEENIKANTIPHFVYHPEYKKKEGEKPTICYEDVLIAILVLGYKLKIVDIEGKGTYTREITIKDVHERVSKTPADHLLDMHNEQDDAVTADVIIQQVFFEGIVFG